MTQPRRDRAVLLTLTAVIALGAVAALVWLLLDRSGDDEPASADPSPPSQEMTEETSEPTQEAATPVPAPYALTSGGDLVELDPQTGVAVRTVGSSPSWTGTLSLTADRQFAYVDAVTGGGGGPAWPGEIQRVSLADGGVETIVTGATDPALSPDGAALAYLAIAPSETQSSERSLTVMDLATGSVTASIPDEQCVECERMVTTPTWTPDGRLLLGLGWVDAFPGVALYAVDPAGTATLGAASFVGPDNSGDLRGDWFGRSAFTGDGMLLVPAEEGTADQWEARVAYAFEGGPAENQPTGVVVVADPATGAVVDRIPVDGLPVSVAAEPEGTAAFVVVRPTTTSDAPSVLYRWDGASLSPVGEGFEAVAW